MGFVVELSTTGAKGPSQPDALRPPLEALDFRRVRLCGGAMGWKWRKSIRIGPGLRANLSKGRVSLSVGRPGATANVSKDGVKVTVGAPGTGVSYEKRLRRGSRPNPFQQSPLAGLSAGWSVLFVPALGCWAFDFTVFAAVLATVGFCGMIGMFGGGKD